MQDKGINKGEFSGAVELFPEELSAILRQDFASFIERSFYELHPTEDLILALYIEVVATKLEAVRRGQIKRLIINLPPRYLKSHCTCIAFVAWMLGHDARKHVFCVSYGQDLADEHAESCLRLMKSRFYRELFGDVLTGRQTMNDLRTICGGRRLASSVGGALTGRGADVIIVDDPHKADDASSEANRESLRSWFDQVLLSRLNQRSEGVIIIVMQRLHKEDLVGHALKQGHWDVLTLPVIAEREERHLIEGPLGRRIFKRNPGEPLNPLHEDIAHLAALRKNTPEEIFACQYMQDPTLPDQARAKKAEYDRRFSEAYQTDDHLELGRLWRNREMRLDESRISDEEAMDSYRDFMEIKAQVESMI